MNTLRLIVCQCRLVVRKFFTEFRYTVHGILIGVAIGLSLAMIGGALQSAHVVLPNAVWAAIFYTMIAGLLLSILGIVVNFARDAVIPFARFVKSRRATTAH